MCVQHAKSFATGNEILPEKSELSNLQKKGLFNLYFILQVIIWLADRRHVAYARVWRGCIKHVEVIENVSCIRADKLILESQLLIYYEMSRDKYKG